MTMEEGFDKNGNDRDDIFSKSVRAGKRTYFLDIKKTKGNDHYITLTESKKTIIDGRESFQKHKIFIYKEDFEKVLEGFTEVIEKAKLLNLESNEIQIDSRSIEFEDL